ncbi:MAG: 16S rRNA (uracil(1498)-N(3))-methyltransferase [Pseudomonadota bacterium]
MPVKRLFVDQSLAAGSTLALDGAAAHYLGRVLRARVGDAVQVFNGDGREFAAAITQITRDAVALAVHESVAAAPEPRVAITLLQALSRNEKMDLAIQKAVELGVHSIRPVAVERSVMRLDDVRTIRRTEHWQQVAIHAAQQCGRAVVPAVHAPVALGAALDASADVGFGIVADPEATQSLGQCLDEAGDGVDAARILVGPEGGLTEGEIALATRSGLHAVRAGPRVLRTETAALALVTVLQWRFGDLGGAGSD